ncbi:hypothetical protein HN841_02020 [archaeon]|nr:hypothetical protein [archaeon]
MELEFNLKRKHGVLLVLLIGVLGYFVHAANPGHDSDHIWIVDINGVERTLQEAIDIGTLGSVSFGSVTSSSCADYSVGYDPSGDSDEDFYGDMPFFGGSDSSGLSLTESCHNVDKPLVGIALTTVSSIAEGWCWGDEAIPGNCGEIYSDRLRCCSVGVN